MTLKKILENLESGVKVSCFNEQLHIDNKQSVTPENMKRLKKTLKEHKKLLEDIQACLKILK